MQNTLSEFDIVQLIYCSHRVHSKSNVSLERDTEDIVVFGQIHNFLYDITGALMTDGEMFAQVIEGPAIAVENLYSKITKDKRHSSIVRLQHVPTYIRLFNHWPIAFIRVESMHYVRTLSARSTSNELRKASASILKAFRPVLLR